MSLNSKQIDDLFDQTQKEVVAHKSQGSTWEASKASTVPQVNDTCEIAFIYMQRHKHMSGMSLGQWFDNAHGLKDEDLYWAVTTLEAKRIIVRKGYNRLSLEPLMHYNAGIGKGE